MKNSLGPLPAIFLVGTALISAPTQAAKNLAVPTVSQLPQTNWCWAATSEAVLSYAGNAPGMCQIADWTRGQNGWGADNCCANSLSPICNQPNWMWGSAGSIKGILANWGADSETYSRALTLTEVKEAIDDDSPIIVRWGWTAGGGHFVIAHGYNGSSISVMDPWNGPTVLSHASLTSTSARTWTHTLIVVPEKITYVIDDTGSMWNEIASVKSTLQSQISGFSASGRFVKYALITYKDSVNYRGSTVSHSTISSWVDELRASGGGACPEEGYGALDKAAEVAPGSDAWWMTDADSHGGYLRMLQTQLNLVLAGVTLHSTIFGACSAPVVAASAEARREGPEQAGYCQNTAPASCDDQVDLEISGGVPMVSQLSVGGSDSWRTAAIGSATAVADVDAFTAGEELSLGTGGLFFATTSADVDEATEIILREISATAQLRRLLLPAGNHLEVVEVDDSVEVLRVILNARSGASGQLTVVGPLGLMSPGDPGVESSFSGPSQMLTLTPPAALPGTYTLETASSRDYVLSVSANSQHSVELVGDTTAGVGKELKVTVSVPSLSLSDNLGGPGTEGPGGPMDNPPRPPLDLPFDPASLQFYIERADGSHPIPLDLHDDGLHDDVFANDGVYGGTVVLLSSGKYRFSLRDGGGEFQRVTELIVSVNLVALSVSADRVVAPGSTITHDFRIENIGSSSRTFNVAISSSESWADLGGLPADVTIAAGDSTVISIPVNVPAGANRGDTDQLAMTVAAEDDPSVTDSVVVKTTAWEGPALESLSSSAVRPGELLTLFGTRFGDDPGAGARSTDTFNVTISGVRVADADVLSWSQDTIEIRVPDGATSGLILVVAEGIQSNELPLSIPEPEVCDVDADGDVDRNDIGVIFAARNSLASGPDDPRDSTGDGIITVNDGRICVLQCTHPRCTP